MEVRKKYLFWLLIIILTITPIIINFNLKEELQRLSTFFWSLYLIPNILIMIKYPKWKVIIGTAFFYSFLKYTNHIIEEGLTSKIELIALILDSFVNGTILLTVGSFRIKYYKLLKQMQKLSIIDSLTGLYNRRYFDIYMEKTIPFSQRVKSPLILIILDIDHFKMVNDNNGHLCGDEALKHISEIIKHNVRNSDAYVRFGGEEFAIISSNTNLDEGQIIADRIREAVEQSYFTYKNEHIHITISIGVALYDGGKLEEFIEKADQALYRAKENGRNQVVSF
ncbi:GGDEF domain-containing protein [Heyndrickxia sp. NPDC080065]|uniref:GGDEF domain-containing protein n=1 Tax=Heyndrickxia sp. NPDC080065 TaxID=3390568 RepID=UPI003D02BB7F